MKVLTGSAPGLHATVQSLEGITLEALMDTAALMSRVDQKYLVDPRLAAQVLRQVGPGAHALEISGSRSFRYCTSYFDLPDLACFYATARQRRKRFKVRVRNYCDSGQSYLEVKTRTGGRLTVKDRIEVDPGISGRPTLPPFAVAYVEGILELRLGWSRGLSSLRNVLTTDYRRMTLALLRAGERITVDEDLTITASDGRRLGFAGQLVVETKSAGSRSQASQLLWRRGCRPLPLSKYATGLALLDPALQRNRWVRTIGKIRLENLFVGEQRERNAEHVEI